MSEEQQPAETTEPEAPATQDADQETITLPDDHPLVRALAAQKQQLKELRTKAQKYDELEESQKTEAQKLAERAETAERELAQTRTSALRAEVALEKGLTKSQAKRLVGDSREELEADADELLKDLGEAAQPRRPKPDRSQGRPSDGSASTADQFAASVGGLL